MHRRDTLDSIIRSYGIADSGYKDLVKGDGDATEEAGHEKVRGGAGAHLRDRLHPEVTVAKGGRLVTTAKSSNSGNHPRRGQAIERLAVATAERVPIHDASQSSQATSEARVI